jgi:hypothetical protein
MAGAAATAEAIAARARMRLVVEKCIADSADEGTRQ